MQGRSDKVAVTTAWIRRIWGGVGIVAMVFVLLNTIFPSEFRITFPLMVTTIWFLCSAINKIVLLWGRRSLVLSLIGTGGFFILQINDMTAGASLSASILGWLALWYLWLFLAVDVIAIFLGDKPKSKIHSQTCACAE